MATRVDAQSNQTQQMIKLQVNDTVQARIYKNREKKKTETLEPIKEIAIHTVIDRVGGDGDEDSLRKAETISMCYSRNHP
jgi:hypothetical protein